MILTPIHPRDITPCMTGFHPLDQEVIHSSWGREIVDNRSGGRVNRSMVPTRFRPLREYAQGGGGRRSSDLREGGSDRYNLGFVEPYLSLVGPPSLTSLAS